MLISIYTFIESLTLNTQIGEYATRNTPGYFSTIGAKKGAETTQEKRFKKLLSGKRP